MVCFSTSPLRCRSPRKCPDQRGLRLKIRLTIMAALLLSPRKCPDQRGLRLSCSESSGRTTVGPRKCPDQRGLRHYLLQRTKRTRNVRGNAPIRGDYDRQCDGTGAAPAASEEMPRSEGITTNSPKSVSSFMSSSEEMPRSEGITTGTNSLLHLLIQASEEMPRSEGITTPGACIPAFAAQVRGNAPIRGDYDRVLPRFGQHLFAGSEEMPRSEGITTYLSVFAYDRHCVRPRKCPDQRGLRLLIASGPRRFGHVGPRKCPDQRGLRLFGAFSCMDRMSPRKCPDQRGLRLTFLNICFAILI